MVSGGSLSGALLIGPKAGGVCYRREELAQLADGARVVGLHLESLRAADLQRSHRELELRLTEILRTSASVTPDARQD